MIRHTHCVILSGAAQRCNGERRNQSLPRSRTPKGRRQAESRHSCMALYNRYQVTFTRNGTTHGSFYNVTFLTVYALYRGAIRRGRPANQPALRPFTNLNHFYPVAGAAGIRSTANGYTKSAPQKERGKNPLS